MFSWFVTNRALRAELRQHHQEIEELKLEWEEWFDKFRRLYARLSRRVERENAEDATAAPPVSREPSRDQQSPQLTLSERQQQINESILKRRTRAV